ncbi:mitochondrial dicarboxylate carrier isoform X2 [Hetaerina americana]|uniref:mitochondrial dicarboxylate carrier isoform X2 n=1 Tax=Hetaerina americana TaxID=62018 RepID=UPI003A7F5D4F
MDNAVPKRLSKWYFGGLASAGAACCTHPLDLLKVHLQTQQEGKLSIIRLTFNIVKQQGVLALYNGLSASLCRQLTYSTTRFGIYELLSITTACPKSVNYKHAFDGLFRVYREEGIRRLFSGASTATSRAVFMTVGQLSFYDQVKLFLLGTGIFTDNFTTHFLSSLTAGAVATALTQPLDVLKTRAMNAKPGEFKSMWHLITYTAKLGPLGFFKGFVPAFVRLGPHTILTFVFLEQLRVNFGTIVVK